MIFGTYRDEHGRLCRVYDGAGGLRELEENYRECGLSADEDETMTIHTSMTPAQALEERIREHRAAHQVSYEVAYRAVLAGDPALAAAYAGVDPPAGPARAPEAGEAIRVGDLAVFSHLGSREEVEGGELVRRAAGDQLHRFALDHQRRTGCPYPEALGVAKRINPEIARAYAGVGPSVEDALRRAGQGDVIIQDGGVNVHLHNYQVKKPGLAGPKTAEEARDALMRLVRQRMKQGPADAMLDVVSTKEGRALLDLVLQGDEEPEAEE